MDRRLWLECERLPGTKKTIGLTSYQLERQKYLDTLYTRTITTKQYDTNGVRPWFAAPEVMLCGGKGHSDLPRLCWTAWIQWPWPGTGTSGTSMECLGELSDISNLCTLNSLCFHFILSLPFHLLVQVSSCIMSLDGVMCNSKKLVSMDKYLSCEMSTTYLTKLVIGKEKKRTHGRGEVHQNEDTSFYSPLPFWHSSSANPFNPNLPSSLTPFTLKLQKKEKDHSRSTGLVPCAIPFNPSHSAPLTSQYPLK